MKTAIYVRVSKEEEGVQNPENQIEPLTKFAESLGFEVFGVYQDRVSGGTSNRPQFQKMLVDAQQHKFDMILVWSLDRFSREGILNTLKYIEKLKANNVALKSLQEAWLDTRDESLGNLLLAIFSWVAEQERLRISERTKAGMKRAKIRLEKEGRSLGRPKGSKDSKPRKKGGYYKRYQK